MQIYEKIRQMRQFKGWSQEQMAEQLQMSVNGYANIERGETDVQMSRLEQIAQLFDMDLMGLLSFGEKNVFYLAGDNNYNAQIVTFSQEATAFELQKCRLLIEQQNKELEYKEKEIVYLKEIIELMKKASE